MAVSTEVNGKIIKWKAGVFSNGLMVASTRENTSTTKRRDMAFFTGKNSNLTNFSKARWT